MHPARNAHFAVHGVLVVKERKTSSQDSASRDSTVQWFEAQTRIPGLPGNSPSAERAVTVQETVKELAQYLA